MAQPDADGFFDLAGVTEIVEHQLCDVAPINEFALEVTGPKKTASLVCIAPGQWEAHAILRACSEACGVTWFDVEVDKVKPMNMMGLDELKIARIVGAIGVRPYLIRKGRYGLASGSPNGVRTPAFGEIVDMIDGRRRVKSYGIQVGNKVFPTGQPGEMTWPMLSLLVPISRKPAGTIQAVHALKLVGLCSRVPICTRTPTRQTPNPRPASTGCRAPTSRRRAHPSRPTRSPPRTTTTSAAW